MAAITKLPQGFTPHPKVISSLRKRGEMLDKSAIDWASAEALAIGGLLLDGKEVRISGEDSRRGTFSQRHAVLFDYITEDVYTPLNHIDEKQSKLRIYDSPLSELAVLGFEYGYSVIARSSLTIWEAQFGDFINLAQPIIDQFLSAAEAKWGQTSNLTLLLPHSYEGQGPEHSSARLERFLQMTAEDNMIVANLSAPAQYFHALRRQTMMPVKLPLILMTPKSLLRHPKAVSKFEELYSGNFKTVIDDGTVQEPDDIKRLIFSSGKIYYELLAHKEKNKIDNVALIRLEQFYPFDADAINEIMSRYRNAKDYVWAQEEPKNMGGWQYVFFKFMDMLNEPRLRYAGRKESASTATGSYKIHLEEQSKLINEAFAGIKEERAY
jgi:2-oxoglutarate dehydrogenase E1 component